MKALPGSLVESPAFDMPFSLRSVGCLWVITMRYANLCIFIRPVESGVYMVDELAGCVCVDWK